MALEFGDKSQVPFLHGLLGVGLTFPPTLAGRVVCLWIFRWPVSRAVFKAFSPFCLMSKPYT